MPTPQFPAVADNASLSELTDAYVGISRYLTYLLSALDTLNISRLDAKVVVTGTLDAGKVTIRVDYSTGAYILLDSSGMTIFDGTQNTFHVDIDGNVTMIGTLNASTINGSEINGTEINGSVINGTAINGGTITGPLIQTALSGVYPRIELSSTGNLLAAYGDSDTYVAINPAQSGDPAVVFYDGGALKGFITQISALTMITLTGIPINIKAGSNLTLDASGLIQLFGAGLTINGNLGFTGSFSTGTQTVDVVNGIITGVSP